MFEVERILAKTVKDGVTYYQVQWKVGNNPEEPNHTAATTEESVTWEPEENLEGVSWMVEEFNKALSAEMQKSGKPADGNTYDEGNEQFEAWDENVEDGVEVLG
jgi:hypothetical protein